MRDKTLRPAAHETKRVKVYLLIIFETFWHYDCNNLQRPFQIWKYFIVAKLYSQIWNHDFYIAYDRNTKCNVWFLGFSQHDFFEITTYTNADLIKKKNYINEYISQSFNKKAITT